MGVVEYGKGLDFQYGVVQINCLEKDFGNGVPNTGITSGSECKIIDKAFTLVYEQETQQWYKQKTLTNGELISPKTISFLSTDWMLITSADTDYVEGLTLYKLIINHTLNTTLFNGYVYDSNDELMVADITTVDVNSIKIISDENFNGKVVLI